MLLQLEGGGGREAVNNGAAYLGESLLLLDSKCCYSKDNPLHSIAMDLVLIGFRIHVLLLNSDFSNRLNKYACFKSIIKFRFNSLAAL